MEKRPKKTESNCEEEFEKTATAKEDIHSQLINGKTESQTSLEFVK